jgi:hypothetical protein
VDGDERLTAAEIAPITTATFFLVFLAWAAIESILNADRRQRSEAITGN